MKLNAYILHQRLSEKYPVKMYGNPNPKMTLLSPELYIDNSLRFYANHVYLATVEHIPSRPQIEENAVLVCISESARLTYYEEHAVVLLIKKKVDFFSVYRTLQNIYEQFASWESELLKCLMHSSSIQDVLNCSYPIFRHSIFVLDSSFRFVAEAYPTNDVQVKQQWDSSQGNLKAQSFLEYIKTSSERLETSMAKKGAVLIDLGINKTLCVNLFDSADNYIGCLCIDQSGRPLTNGEDQLAEFLANIILHLNETNPMLLGNSRNSLKEISQVLIKELPLSQNQKLILKSVNYKQQYICIAIHCMEQFSKLPVSYLCSMLENMFSKGLFFEYNNTIVGLLGAEEQGLLTDIEQNSQLDSLIQGMQLYIGISNSFSDLYMLRTYCLQAEAAIENGRIYKPEASVYSFSEFALCEMVINAFGGFPMETFFPEGFRKLIEHDQTAEISYLETLSVYLEENMSYSKTARRLYIHRSTLIERIERIERELSFDLNSPENRLLLMLLLKARQIEQQIKEK
ncbi:MAG: helix-turn-helix domain-containing protein [Lachnospiraceae bacterium]|nr:helix-turn-helix domain-containing protein [Lachnospiraceae bacterium]